jgi:hypothetical protein
MTIARAAATRLRALPKPYGAVPESPGAVHVACIEAVTLYVRELWWDYREVGRRDNLQLLLTQQARSILGALPTTPRGALIRKSGLTLAPVLVDSREQQFAA